LVACPSCHKPIEVNDQHLGTLFTCPHCNSVYFIDWNGQPEMAQPEPEMTSDNGFDGASIENPLDNPYAGNNQHVENPLDISSMENSLEDSLDAIESGGYDMPLENPLSDLAVASSNDNYSSDGDGAPMDGLDETPYDFNQPLATNVIPIIPATPDTNDFSDVTDFGNASAAVGPLAYTLIIEGIESSLLLKELREAMMDSRFRWDVNGILQQVRGGRLVITGLDPAKAAVFLNRLKYLPFKLSWRQDVLSGN
jgi:uncharacterized protein YbaR (Trm112 family)